MMELFNTICTTESTGYAVGCSTVHGCIAGGLGGLSAQCTRPGDRTRVHLHHPTLVVDENLYASLAPDPLSDMLDERLPIVGIAGGQEKASTGKRDVRDTACKFHLHLATTLADC